MFRFGLELSHESVSAVLARVPALCGRPSLARLVCAFLGALRSRPSLRAPRRLPPPRHRTRRATTSPRALARPLQRLGPGFAFGASAATRVVPARIPRGVALGHPPRDDTSPRVPPRSRARETLGSLPHRGIKRFRFAEIASLASSLGDVLREQRAPPNRCHALPLPSHGSLARARHGPLNAARLALFG